MNPTVTKTLLQKTKEKLLHHTQCFEGSEFYSLTIELLSKFDFMYIRCLALGSPTEEFQPLYQLALLELIRAEFEIPKTNVSLYDPAFTSDDLELFKELGNYTIEEENNWDSSSTLYYMPHAPRSMTEKLLTDKRPQWILGNDLSVTIGTLSSAKFLETYPTLATIVHLSEQKEPTIKQGSDFTVVTNKRTRKRPNKLVYTPPPLTYDTDSLYFKDVKISRIESPENASWKDSFSDLAFNQLMITVAES